MRRSHIYRNVVRMMGAIAAGAVLGFHPIVAQATETVYGCRFDPGASPPTWTLIRHDDSTGKIRVSAPGNRIDGACYPCPMNGFERANLAGKFGSGEFEFGEWATPFTDAAVEILEIAYAPRDTGPHMPVHAPSHLRGQDGRDLVARVHARDAKSIYRVVFPVIAAMRLLDEGGLIELWQKTQELGGRPGRTTFRVRNHAWTHESVVSFLASDGWSFVIASDDECLEVVSLTAPIITEE